MENFSYKPESITCWPGLRFHFANGILWVDGPMISTSIRLNADELNVFHKVASNYKSLNQDNNCLSEVLYDDDDNRFLIELVYDEEMMFQLMRGGIYVCWQLPVEEVDGFIEFIQHEVINRKAE